MAPSLRAAATSNRGMNLGLIGCRGEACGIAQRAANAAIDAYMANIGGTTEAVARSIVDTLNLHDALKPRMEQYGFKEPWEALYK